MLEKTLEILDKKESWCKANMAQDAHGYQTSPLASDACSFCMLGAIAKASGALRYEMNGPFRAARTFLQELLEKHYDFFSVAHFNDSHYTTHESVKRVLQHALQKLK